MSTAAAHITTDITLVPALRFKEFDEEWNLKTLSSSIEIVAGYAFKSTEMENTPSTYQIIKMSNVYKSKLQLDRSLSYWEKIDKKQAKFLLRKKDILLTLTGTVGKKDFGYSIVIPEDNKFLLNQRLVYLRYIENISDGDFINNLIKTSRFFYFFFNESKGGTGNQTNVGIEDLKNIKLSFPTLPEQQKIASFLSAVDEKIQQLTKKKELLEQYKKGVMQQLFSGELRFNDENGNRYPDWEEMRLGEICTGISYGMNAAATTYDGKNKYLRITDIDESSNGLNSEKVTSPNGLLEDKFRVKEGDILFARTGASVGKSYLYRISDGILYFAGFLIRFHVMKGDSSFIYLQTQTSRYDKWVKVMSMRSGQPGINAEEYKTLAISFPCLEEQQKIASFLSGIDTKIAQVAELVEATQTFKKGLLQQMFV